MLKKELFNGVKACIFDLDGTLVDSMSLWYQIDIAFFSAHGMEVPKDYVKAISHMNFMEMANYTHDKYHLKETPAQIAEIWTNMSLAAYSHDIKAKEGAKEFLSILKNNGIKISLATTNKAILYESCLRNNDMWGYFDYAIDVNSLGSSKKEPLIYQLLARKMNVQPSETIVFEDIIMAAKTAHDAGFRTVAVSDEASKNDRDELIRTSDYFLKNYNELINYDK
ncbi:MAG: HAD family phosphatase [Bacilli bacterium]